MESGEFRLLLCIASSISISAGAWEELWERPLDLVEPAMVLETSMKHRFVSWIGIFGEYEAGLYFAMRH